MPLIGAHGESHARGSPLPSRYSLVSSSRGLRAPLLSSNPAASLPDAFDAPSRCPLLPSPPAPMFVSKSVSLVHIHVLQGYGPSNDTPTIITRENLLWCYRWRIPGIRLVLPWHGIKLLGFYVPSISCELLFYCCTIRWEPFIFDFLRSEDEFTRCFVGKRYQADDHTLCIFRCEILLVYGFQYWLLISLSTALPDQYP